MPKIKTCLILAVIILFFAGCHQSPNYTWLQVIEKDEYPSFAWDGFGTCKYAVIMRTEDNHIVSTSDFELFNLVNPGDTINAKVKYLKTIKRGNVKLYRISDIEFVGE